MSIVGCFVQLDKWRLHQAYKGTYDPGLQKRNKQRHREPSGWLVQWSEAICLDSGTQKIMIAFPTEKEGSY